MNCAFTYAWFTMLCFLCGDETPASSESRLFAIERSERAKGVLRAKTGRGFILTVSMGGPRKKSSESQLFAIERKACSERRFIRREKRMNERGVGPPRLRRYISFFNAF